VFNVGGDFRGQVVSDQFLNLIQDAHLKYGERAAVIIDEYDKPLLSAIDIGDWKAVEASR